MPAICCFFGKNDCRKRDSERDFIDLEAPLDTFRDLSLREDSNL
jgi:hypothetical protein